MKVNIIGSGISGLVTGALLAKNGHEVNVFEQYADIGGVTGGFRKNGYSWDLGQLIMEGLGPGEQAGKVIDELGLRDQIKLIAADRIYSFPEFTIKPPKEYQGPWWRKDLFLQLFPDEKKGIERYYRYYKRMMKIISLARLAEKSAGVRKAMFQLGMYATLLPLLPKANWSAEQLMDSFFHGPEIKGAFTSILADFVVRTDEFQGLGVAMVNPEPAFDKRVPLQISKYSRQPSYTYIDGGCRTLVDLLAGVIRTNGGQIHTNSEVTGIVVENNRVQGLTLADGSYHACDAAVATGGAKETFGGLLQADALPDEFRKIVDEIPLMESVFMIHLGLDIDPSEHLESGINYFYRTYDISGSVNRLRTGIYHEGREGFLICNPSLYSPQSAPEGCYAVTIYTVAPDQAADFHWADQKQAMAKKLLDLAREEFPQLQEHIVEMEIITPEDFRKLTHQQHHAFGGCAPVMNQKATPYRTPVDGLWFAGAQSESGAGINNVVEGAWRVAHLILNESDSNAGKH